MEGPKAKENPKARSMVVRVHRRGQTLEYTTHRSLPALSPVEKGPGGPGNKIHSGGADKEVESSAVDAMRTRLLLIAIVLLLIFFVPLAWMLSYSADSELDAVDPRPALLDLSSWSRPTYAF